LTHNLKKQGLSVSAIARKVGCDQKTVRKYLELGLEAPVYSPRRPRARVIEPYERYLHERVQAFPDLREGSDDVPPQRHECAKVGLRGSTEESGHIIRAQGGVKRGPVTVSSWRNSSGGEPDFEIYSMNGAGQAFPYGRRGSLSTFENTDGLAYNWEVADGDVIELPQYHPLGIVIDGITSFETADLRELNYEIDFGERYPAQFHSYDKLPDGLVPKRAHGSTLGIYYGFAAGHVYRGTDMSGNQVLTKDYTEPGGKPVGVMDRTVTVSVGDGLTTVTKTFTVRIAHWLRYYSDTAATKTYLPNAFMPQEEGAPAGERTAVIYVSRTNDFSEAEIGPGIWHHYLPEGEFGNKMWLSSQASERPTRYPGEVIRNTANATQIINGIACDAGGTPVPTASTFPFSENSNKITTLVFKGGETFFPQETLGIGSFSRGAGFLVTSWGTGRATIDFYKHLGTWGFVNSGGDYTGWLDAVKDNGSSYGGWHSHNIIYSCSEYDPADPEWREWWNIIQYQNRSGVFTENSATGFDVFNGEILTNAGNTCYTMIMRDVDNGDGTGYFICRQCVNTSDMFDDAAIAATFADGETLTGMTNGGTVTFVAAGSRMDRMRKAGPNFYVGAQNLGLNRTGKINVSFDSCIIRGAKETFSTPGSYLFRNDTLLANWWDYGMIGAAWMLFDSGFVGCLSAKDPDGNPYIGRPKDTNGGNAVAKRFLNSVKSSLPTAVMENNPAHTYHRAGSLAVTAMHKIWVHSYGGHTDQTDDSNPFVSNLTLGGTQPLFRGSGNLEANEAYYCVVDCVLSGGGSMWSCGVNVIPVSAPQHCFLMDSTVLRRGEWIKGQGFISGSSGPVGVRDCRLEYPTSLVMGPQFQGYVAVQQPDKALNVFDLDDFGKAPDDDDLIPDDPATFPNSTLPAPSIKNCEVIVGAAGIPSWLPLRIQTEQRGKTIVYEGNTIEIRDPDGTPGTPAITVDQIENLPTGWTIVP
jgi:hypothetical protein